MKKGRKSAVNFGSAWSIYDIGDELVQHYKFTEYFENEVLRKRPYIKKKWCIHALESPVKVERQEHNRYRFWASIDELDGRFLRVITLNNKTQRIPRQQI